LSKQAKTFKGSVASLSVLPISGNTEGDARVVRDTGYQYYWSITSGSGSIHDWKLLNDPEPSAITTDEKLNLELENEFMLASKTYYIKLTYVGATNKVAAKDVYTDSGMTVKLFNKTITRTGNKVIKTTLTRISDGATKIKDIGYIGNKVDDLNVG